MNTAEKRSPSVTSTVNASSVPGSRSCNLAGCRGNCGICGPFQGEGPTEADEIIKRVEAWRGTSYGPPLGWVLWDRLLEGLRATARQEVQPGRPPETALQDATRLRGFAGDLRLAARDLGLGNINTWGGNYLVQMADALDRIAERSEAPKSVSRPPETAGAPTHVCGKQGFDGMRDECPSPDHKGMIAPADDMELLRAYDLEPDHEGVLWSDDVAAVIRKIVKPTAGQRPPFDQEDVATIQAGVEALFEAKCDLSATALVGVRNRVAEFVATEHFPDCPVYLGASVDCAPPGDCAVRRASSQPGDAK